VHEVGSAITAVQTSFVHIAVTPPEHEQRLQPSKKLVTPGVAQLTHRVAF
jgi:hypothetical protein